MTALCKLDYPVYTCEVLDDNHVVVAGGGGAAKTGVPNAVDVLKIEKVGKNPQADPSERLEMGDTAPMNMSVLHQGKDKPSLLAVGRGGKCSIYSVVHKSRPVEENAESAVKHRKTKMKNDKRRDDISQQSDHYTFKLLKVLDTDFSLDPLQKVVRISRDGKLLVTGGSDGYVRVWNATDFAKKFFVQGHKDDVTDVDVSPDGAHVVSVSRDGTAVIWNAENGKKEVDLHLKWNIQMETRAYRFRCCRYATVIESPKNYVLFTAHAPVRPGTNKKSPKGCLTKWARKPKDGNDSTSGPLVPAVIQFTGKEAISSMTVSADGVFLGVGFMEGSVAIYISFSLQCAKKISNLHSIFVTGTTFLRESETSRAITGPCDAALVSVSADNTCKLTKLSSRTFFPVWVAILLSAIALILTGLLMNHLGII